MSQSGLATAIGVSMDAVSKWERGLAIPRRHTAELADTALEADGSLLAAFGYGPVNQPAGGDDVRDRVAALQRVVVAAAEATLLLLQDELEDPDVQALYDELGAALAAVQ